MYKITQMNPKRL